MSRTQSANASLAFLTNVYSAFGESEVPPNNFATCSYRLHVIACCSVLLSILGNDPTHNARTPSSVSLFLYVYRPSTLSAAHLGLVCSS